MVLSSLYMSKFFSAKGCYVSIPQLLWSTPWEDFVQREGIEIPEFEDDADFSGFLEEPADLPEDRHWTHEPKYGENVWNIEGVKV